MMAFEPEVTRTDERVRVDGVWHLRVTLPTLEALAFDLPGRPIHYPETTGYATFQLSNVRLAAQFGGAA
jgi:hypothetical protein